ncbi:MAG: hypothetical protein D6795_02445 [Deltaproteobacteria bacterium]|nr:MAG: hypothetical protein D6795_02445 [Deltaproteobacteria bacterium]
MPGPCHGCNASFISPLSGNLCGVEVYGVEDSENEAMMKRFFHPPPLPGPLQSCEAFRSAAGTRSESWRSIGGNERPASPRSREVEGLA